MKHTRFNIEGYVSLAFHTRGCKNLAPVRNNM
jgi:hypothetical protein